jgi:hypothetical protein
VRLNIQNFDAGSFLKGTRSYGKGVGAGTSWTGTLQKPVAAYLQRSSHVSKSKQLLHNGQDRKGCWQSSASTRILCPRAVAPPHLPTLANAAIDSGEYRLTVLLEMLMMVPSAVGRGLYMLLKFPSSVQNHGSGNTCDTFLYRFPCIVRD